MKETAGGLGRALRRVRPMGIWRELCGRQALHARNILFGAAIGKACYAEFVWLGGAPGGSCWPILWVYTSIEQSGAVAGGKCQYPWGLLHW